MSATVTSAPPTLATAALARTSARRSTSRFFNPLVISGSVIIALVAGFCLIYPAISPHSPTSPRLHPTHVRESLVGSSAGY